MVIELNSYNINIWKYGKKHHGIQLSKRSVYFFYVEHTIYIHAIYILTEAPKSTATINGSITVGSILTMRWFCSQTCIKIKNIIWTMLSKHCIGNHMCNV